jgi:hypothetical protein
MRPSNDARTRTSLRVVNTFRRSRFELGVSEPSEAVRAVEQKISVLRGGLSMPVSLSGFVAEASSVHPVLANPGLGLSDVGLVLNAIRGLVERVRSIDRQSCEAVAGVGDPNSPRVLNCDRQTQWVRGNDPPRRTRRFRDCIFSLGPRLDPWLPSVLDAPEPDGAGTIVAWRHQ